MRMTMISVLVVLAHLAVPANAQSQAAPSPAWSVSNGYFVHPPSNRLFFFMSDPKNIGQPPVLVRPAHPPASRGFIQPFSFTAPIPRSLSHPTLKSPSLESMPPQDFRKFLRPKNSRLFYFSKP
jgi:hypothetical protein